MSSANNQLVPDRLRRQTERALSRGLRSVRDPRAEYERLIRRMHRESARVRPLAVMS